MRLKRSALIHLLPPFEKWMPKSFFCCYQFSRLFKTPLFQEIKREQAKEKSAVWLRGSFINVYINAFMGEWTFAVKPLNLCGEDRLDSFSLFAQSIFSAWIIWTWILEARRAGFNCTEVLRLRKIYAFHESEHLLPQSLPFNENGGAPFWKKIKITHSILFSF